MATPPSYASTSNSGLPSYSAAARPDERSVSANVSPTDTPCQEYQYKNGRLTLNLGPKHPGIFMASYGWNGIVNGFAQVKKKTTNVRSIIVTLEGQMTTGITERGFLTDQSRATVLKMSQTLYDSSSGEKFPTDEARFGFSFALPSYAMNGTHPLPPTFSILNMGQAADVSYSIKVEMIRNGKLRQNDRIKAGFYYLPRTYAPDVRQMSIPEYEKLAYDDWNDGWQSFEILPRSPQENLPRSPCDLRVSFALPQPLIYASGSAIPFRLNVKSGSMMEAVPALFSCLSVDMIRVTKFRAGERWHSSERVLGGGAAFRVEEREGQRTMYGSVNSERLGESSWSIEDIEVKHFLRIKLAPRNDIASLAGALPTFLQMVPVEMRTNQQGLGEAEEVRTPAFCRLFRPAAVRTLPDVVY